MPKVAFDSPLSVTLNVSSASGIVSPRIATENVCVSGPPNSERLPPFHQLDVLLDKRWVFSSFTLGVYLDVMNTLNHDNVEAVEYDYRDRETAPGTGIPILPTLGVRGQW